MLAANFNTTASRISNFYALNNLKYNKSLSRVASGENLEEPRDNIGDFFRARKADVESTTLSYLKRDVNEAQMVLEVAQEAGGFVFDDLSKMRQLVTAYWHEQTTDVEKAAYINEFDALKEKIQTVMDTTYYDGRKLIDDSSSDFLRSVSIDTQDLTNTIDIYFDSNDLADISGLTLDGANEEDVRNDVMAELGKAGNYMAKVSSFQTSLESHYSLMDDKITKNTEYSAQLTNVNDANEMISVVDRNIRAQSSLAMLSQTNRLRQGLLALLA